MKSINIKTLAVAVLSCLITLFVIEQVSRTYLMTVEEFGDAFTHTRNPSYRRGWVEYTAMQPINTDHLIIVITGSQAWAGEVANDDDIYTSILASKLNENSTETYTVLNWGVPGVDAPEYIILMTRLADYDPDLIIFITDWKDMTDNLGVSLSQYGTDVVRLAYDPTYRQYLSPLFLEIHQANDPLQFLHNLTYIGILHTYLLVDLPRNWGHDDVAERKINPQYATESNKSLPDWSEQVDWYLESMMATYMSSAGETPLIVITAPQYTGWFNEDARQKVRSLFGKIRSAWGNLSHVQLIDGTDWIPHNLFFDSSHFDEIGHQIMAEKLFTVIQDK